MKLDQMKDSQKGARQLEDQEHRREKRKVAARGCDQRGTQESEGANHRPYRTPALTTLLALEPRYRL